jgi:hypothetical protein
MYSTIPTASTLTGRKCASTWHSATVPISASAKTWPALQLALPALLRRFPNLRTTVSDEEIHFKDDSIVYGVHELPVTW